jgi:cell division protein FtsA
MRKIIACLDVGSCYLKLLIGEVYKSKVNVLSCVETPSRGIKNGFIVNPESTIESLKELFSKGEETFGFPIKQVIVTVPVSELESFVSNASVTIQNEDSVITHEDLIKCLRLTIGSQISPNMELLGIMPTQFIINDTDKVPNPIGVIGNKLTIKDVITIVPKKNIMPITSCLEKLNIKVVDYLAGPYGDYYEFKTKETQDSVGAIINIGGSNTIVSIFNKGILTSSETLPIGGINIDSDIGYVYKIGRNDAMYLKEKLALAYKEMAQPNESISLNNKNGDTIKINQYDLSEICESRLEEILNLAKKQINLLTKKEISYIIVTGGVTEFTDFDYLLQDIFNHKAIIGNVSEIGCRNNSYSTAIGEIKYYNSRLKLKHEEFSILNLDDQEELSGIHKKVNISDSSLLGKLFSYFFDN